jgi:hypothetical protein
MVAVLESGLGRFKKDYFVKSLTLAHMRCEAATSAVSENCSCDVI